MRSQELFAVFFVALCGGAIWTLAAEAASGIETECQNELTKVTNCLGYATGKAAAPSKECCSSVTEIKSSHPVCLCFFIVQAHNGSEQIKTLGIQEARILQLPSACKLVNASISDCPKLLGIPAGSPNYAIFTKNATSAASPSTNTGTSSPAKANDSSAGSQHGPHFAAGTLVALFFFFFSSFAFGVSSAP